MRSGSPQGYSGRSRAAYSGNGGQQGQEGMAAKPGEIWEVVSALANALQDARNQLVNLMNTSQRGTGQSPTRLYGGRPGSNSYVETVGEAAYQQRGTLPRNVHRNHAHGHVAFGLNSEFPVHPGSGATPRRQRAQSVMSGAQRVSRAPIEPPAASPRRCNHPLHQMGADARSLTPRRPQTSWPSSRVADCRKSHVDDLSRRDRACVNISSRGRSQVPGGDPKNSSGGASRRHGNCLGTQFISLLKQEAHQIRERRLAEESYRDRRPGWSRC